MSYARSERASSSRDTNSIDMAQPDRPGVLDVQTALAAVETKERRKRWRGRPSYAKDDVSRSFHLNHLTADRVSDRVNQPYRVAATNGLPGIFLRAQNASHGVRALSAAFGALSAVSSLPLPSLPFSADRSGCIAWTYGAGMRVSQDTPRSRARSLLCKQPENIGIDRLSTLAPNFCAVSSLSRTRKTSPSRRSAAASARSMTPSSSTRLWRGVADAFALCSEPSPPGPHSATLFAKSVWWIVLPPRNSGQTTS